MWLKWKNANVDIRKVNMTIIREMPVGNVEDLEGNVINMKRLTICRRVTNDI